MIERFPGKPRDWEKPSMEKKRRRRGCEEKEKRRSRKIEKKDRNRP